jgi:hypothetical protein
MPSKPATGRSTATAGHGGLHHRRACACHCLSSAPPSSSGSTPRHRSFVAGKVMWIKWQVGRTRVYFVAHGWHSPMLAALAAASCSFSARPAALCRHLQARGALVPAARGWQPSPQSCAAVRRHAGVAFHRAKHGQAAVPHEAGQVQAPTAPLSACGRATFGAAPGTRACRPALAPATRRRNRRWAARCGPWPRRVEVRGVPGGPDQSAAVRASGRRPSPSGL